MLLVRDINDIAAYHKNRRAPWIGFREVAPAAHSLQRPPLFVLGPATPSLLHALAAQTGTPRVGCYSIRAALVAPTGIPIVGGVALHGDAFLHPRHVAAAISDRLNAEPPPIYDIAGDVALLCGPAHETYGHWLVDFLPRLWVLHQAGHDLALLRYLVPADLQPLGFTLLRLCGIRDDQLLRTSHWEELPRVERLLLPTGLRLGDRLAPCFAEATAFWIRRTRQSPSAPAGASLYLARTGGTRTLVNRASIEAVARDRGFTIIHPDQMPPSAQIALFANAGIIAGEYGSALHNAVFAGASATVCALRGNARHPSLVQSGIATAMGQNTGYVLGDTEGQDAHQAFHIEEHLFALGLDLARQARADAVRPLPLRPRASTGPGGRKPPTGSAQTPPALP